MEYIQTLIESFDLDVFLQQFLYDSKNPLLFNNGFFVYFFTLFILLFFILRNHHQARKYMFCLFSLYFFYKASGWFVGLVILSAVVDFFLSNAIYRAKSSSNKKILLIFSIVFNLGILFYFKYTDFFIEISNNFLKTNFNPLNLLLPIGISFYTFENLSYTIDVYRGQFKPASKFSDYLLFLAFFPKLMMGPIVRADDFVPQINRPYVISERDFAKGFYLIISGLIKKLIISDYITLNMVDYIFDNPSLHAGVENIFAVYGYAMVIYCDFSGYSEIAIGIALWLGFKIPPNFASPYQSSNITEFWRRWHISLSSWLKDYLYIPLGGNRRFSLASFIFVGGFLVGSFFTCIELFELSYSLSFAVSGGILLIFLLPAVLTRDSKGIAANFNLLTTMLLGGFWHGASWNFIIWGAIHGIGLGLHKIWKLLLEKSSINLGGNIFYVWFMRLLTFHFVCFAWVFFKADSFSTAMALLQQVFYNFDAGVFLPFYENYKNVLFMIAIAMLLHMIPDNLIDKILDRRDTYPMFGYVLVFFVFLMVYGYFKSAEQVMPIYLQF